MKRVPFNANEKDEARLNDLAKKLGITMTAVIREAIRLLHKKEITK